MESLWQKYGGSIQFVAVNTKQTQADLISWLNGLAATPTFPVLHDPTWSITSDYWGGGWWPGIYIIGADRTVKVIYANDEYAPLWTASEFEGHILDALHSRDAVDIEMVMDVSGSMNSSAPSDPGGDSKLDLMKQASTMIINHLRINGQTDDRMGLVWFTDGVDEYQVGQNKLFSIQNKWSDLTTEINTHGTGTCTAMGAGLQTAFNTLQSSTSDRFAILITDGIQNIEPKVSNASGYYEITDSGGWLCGAHSGVQGTGVNISTYNTKVHTIGIGITANYEPTLQGIATQTGGFYRATNDPQNDLTLIYFVNLCSCLSGGSPAVIYHNTNTHYAENCQTIEKFHVNKSASKFTAMLSWQKSSKSDLTFWLRGPDGELLMLENRMKVFDTFCMVTIYLPWQQGGREFSSVGQWEMIIRGETETGTARYQAIVIGEDKETKYILDYQRKDYSVGDILPLRISLLEKKEPVLKVHDIVIEAALPRFSLGEIMEKYKTSYFELKNIQTTGTGGPEALIAAKLKRLEGSPEAGKLLKQVRQKLSLKEGSIDINITDKEIVVPFELKQSGLHSFKIRVYFETSENGIIERTDYISVLIRPGKASAKNTLIIPQKVVRKRRKDGILLYLTPRNTYDQNLGPGLSEEIEVVMDRKTVPAEIVDLMDGSYHIELMPSTKKRTRSSVTVMLQGAPIWEGKL